MSANVKAVADSPEVAADPPDCFINVRRGARNARVGASSIHARGLFAAKDLHAGEAVLAETPLVAQQDLRQRQQLLCCGDGLSFLDLGREDLDAVYVRRAGSFLCSIAATPRRWSILRGDESRRRRCSEPDRPRRSEGGSITGMYGPGSRLRRGRDDGYSPWRRVAATPRGPSGSSYERQRECAREERIVSARVYSAAAATMDDSCGDESRRRRGTDSPRRRRSGRG